MALWLYGDSNSGTRYCTGCCKACKGRAGGSALGGLTTVTCNTCNNTAHAYTCPARPAGK